MNHDESWLPSTSANDGSGGVKRARPPQREFQRAYKACVSCRKRKSKCEISAEEYTANQPCTRCRRELKECIFTEERPSKSRAIARHDDRPELNVGVGHVMPERAASQSTNAQVRLHRPQEPASQLPLQHDVPAIAETDTPNDSLMRTVVSSGNDALNLLFEAAHHQTHGGGRAAEAEHSVRSADENWREASTQDPRQVPGVPPEVRRLWSACRFVKMGWLSVNEAVYLLDKFYETLSPLSPILTDFYRRPENHHDLLTQEPMLCSTILCISARYNNLPTPGGVSRTLHIHERLWEYCERVLLRIMLGQERGAVAKTRTLGTVEALLLWTEWHPRVLHFPPAYDGWDSDLLLIADPEDAEGDTDDELDGKARWLEDVVNPAKRSDRMSWMLAGSALSLAHELAVFDETKDEQTSDPTKRLPGWERVAEQRYRLRKLLYLYIEQLSFRLGCKTLITNSLARAVGPAKSPTTWVLRSPESWQAFIAAQIELTKTLKSAADVLFPSPAATRSLLQSGRYATLIEHFTPLIRAFKEKHLQAHLLAPRFFDTLSVEYHHARVYLNSLGVQAIVERTLAEALPGSPAPRASAMNLDGTDLRFIGEVVDGSLAILTLTSKLADEGSLVYSPVRVFLRAISASMLLLKGLSLGVSSTKLKMSLDILDRAIAALRSGALDDIHLGSRYASLLEMHVRRLRGSFVPSAKPTEGANELAWPAAPLQNDRPIVADFTREQPHLSLSGELNGLDTFAGVDDWLTLPFDPSIFPFGDGDAQSFSWLADGTMDFAWNLDT